QLPSSSYPPPKMCRPAYVADALRGSQHNAILARPKTWGKFYVRSALVEIWLPTARLSTACITNPPPRLTARPIDNESPGFTQTQAQSRSEPLKDRALQFG